MPVPTHAFDKTRYPLVQDILLTSKGLQFILKNVKNMKFDSQFKSCAYSEIVVSRDMFS